MSGPVAVQALVTGLATGAAYGLIALGFTLVHRLTGMLAFAHGDVVTGAVFVGVLAVIGTTPIAAPLGAGRDGRAGAASRSPRARCSRSPSTWWRCGRSARDVLGWVAGGLAAGLLVRELLGLPFAQQAYALPDPLGSPGIVGARRRRDRPGAGARGARDRPRRGRAGRARRSRSPARAR